MFVVDLECSSNHQFEGWYDTQQEYADIRDAKELTCPLCGTDEVRQVLSTGGIKTTKTERRQKRQPEGVPLEVQKQLAKLVQHVRATHDDVGDDFADRAIAMHEGREDHRPIRGSTDEAGERQLDKKGVPYLKVPVPDIETN